MLVGDGYAAAPLFPLAERLRERGCAVTLVVAGADEAHLLSALEARRSARAVTVVTADGSVGLRGRVADAPRPRLLAQASAEVVYAAGPTPPCTPSRRPPRPPAPGARPPSSEPLPCATGLCQGCAVPVVGEDGVAAHGPRLRRRAGVPRRPGPLARPAGEHRMTVTLAGLTLASPVLVAAGCGGTGRELAAYGDLADLGGFVTRSITLNARPGGRDAADRRDPVRPGQRRRPAEPRPRPLPGHRAAVAGPQQGARVVVSIAGSTLGEYAELARRLGRAPGVSAIEVNLSVARRRPARGVFDVREPFHAASVVAAVRRDLPRGIPVLAKLRTDVVRVVETARTVLDAGADAVVIGNALPAAMPDGRAGRAERPRDPAARAALRGRGARRAARRPDRRRRAASPTADDVRAFLAAGATAVQIGTALLHDPTTAAPARDRARTSKETAP